MWLFVNQLFSFFLFLFWLLSSFFLYLSDSSFRYDNHAPETRIVGCAVACIDSSEMYFVRTCTALLELWERTFVRLFSNLSHLFYFDAFRSPPETPIKITLLQISAYLSGGKSTETALHEVIGTIKWSLHYNQYTLAALILHPIERAFNSVSKAIKETLIRIKLKGCLMQCIILVIRTSII